MRVKKHRTRESGHAENLMERIDSAFQVISLCLAHLSEAVAVLT